MLLRYLSLLYSILATATCSVVINEINSMGPGTDPNREKHRGRHGGVFFIESHEFIELKSEQPKGFKLLGLSTGKSNQKLSPPTIELVVDLWDQTTDLVIGGPAIQNAQLKIPHKNIMYREMFKSQPQQLLMSNFLLNGWSNAKAVVLIYKQNEMFSDFELRNFRTSIIIDDKVLKIIKENLVDMVVLYRGSFCGKMSVIRKDSTSFCR